MIRHDLSHLVRSLVLLGAGAAAAHAQEFGRNGFGGGGPPSPEESFRRIDRNGNDTIDPEEWEALPAGIRRAYEDLADLSRPMDFDDFAEVSQKMREQMLSRFGGGRGADFGRGGGFGQRERSGGSSEGDDSPADSRDSGSRRRGGFGAGGFGGGGFSGGRGADGSGDASTGSGNSEKKTEGSTKAAKTRTMLNMKLPEQFRSRDKDRDGQIGLYEWRRSDYAGFQKLDLNGDGFLTPQELLRAGGRASAPNTATASAASAGSGASAPASAGSTPSNRAETAFKLLDKNSDGSISEEEWSRSFTARPTFEKAGINVNLPLSRNEFLRLFPQAYPTAAK